MPADQALRLRLVVPAQLGVFASVALQTALGRSLDDIVAPIAAGPPKEHRPLTGPPERRYPLELSPAKGFWLEVPFTGQIGLFNDGGALRVTVPQSALSWLDRVAHARQRGPHPSADGRSVDVWLKVAPDLVIYSFTLLDTYTIRIEGR